VRFLRYATRLCKMKHFVVFWALKNPLMAGQLVLTFERLNIHVGLDCSHYHIIVIVRQSAHRHEWALRHIDGVRSLLEPSRYCSLVAVLGEYQPFSVEIFAGQQITLGVGPVPHLAALRCLVDPPAELMDCGICDIRPNGGAVCVEGVRDAVAQRADIGQVAF
jgi:hypothetical protein